MTPKLPVVSGGEAIAAFERIGYRVVRQRGSHVRMIHPSGGRRVPLSVPLHDPVKPGLLRRLLRDADLSVGEFVELLVRRRG